MPRYATIDLNSGFVWWLGYADDPEEACRMSPVTEAGAYKRISPSQAKDTGGTVKRSPRLRRNGSLAFIDGGTTVNNERPDTSKAEPSLLAFPTETASSGARVGRRFQIFEKKVRQIKTLAGASLPCVSGGAKCACNLRPPKGVAAAPARLATVLLELVPRNAISSIDLSDVALIVVCVRDDNSLSNGRPRTNCRSSAKI